MDLRKINRIVKSTTVDMGGFKVEQPLPNFGMEQFDPFLLIHHAKHIYPRGNRPNESGVGPHPHRGFSPITFIFEGSIHHRDSRGNNQIVDKGGMQWMNAGMGIIHSERPSKDFANKGGTSEIIQLWINSPKSQKMNEPYYQPVHINEVPKIEKTGGSILYVYAGIYDSVTGPVKTPFPITLLRIDIKKGAKLNLETEATHNVLAYQLDGAITINERDSNEKNLIVFERENGVISISAQEDTRMVLLSAEPLNEPVSTYGPYVMNTQTELLEAMRDYQMGKMGVLIEEFD